MTVQEVGLSWIVVKNIEESIAYYTEVVGLKLAEFNPQYGWAELTGHDGGTRLGIAQASPQSEMTEGSNAVVTFTVSDLESAKASMLAKGAKADGDVLEVPGHVKMQTLLDADGNRYQICQILGEKS